MTSPATAAPVSAPVLNRAWKRTRADGLADQAVGRLGVHGRVDGAAGDLHQDEHDGEGPAVLRQREHAQEDRPGEQRDPQQPACPDAVGEVRHDRARCTGHRDGDRQQHTQLGVVEREGALDVEEHHGPAAPEEAEGAERRHHRAHPREEPPLDRVRGRAQECAGGARLGQERGAVDHDPRDPSGAHQSAAVALEPGGGHREGQAAALDLDQRGLGQHDRPHGRPAPGGRTGPGWPRWPAPREVAVGGPAGGLLAQRDEPGRGEHGDVARAEVLGRVLVAHRQVELGAQPGVRSVPRGGVGGGWIGGHDDYDTAVTDTALIDPDVLERVLSTALAGGGDMAEVFAEDAVTASAMLDDRRVEELSSGRSRGAGIRVVEGETTGFAHTADLSETGLAGRRPGRGRGGSPGRRRGAHGGARSAGGPRAGRPHATRSVDKARKLELLTPGRRGGPRRRRRHHARCRSGAGTAGAGC